MAAAAVVLSVSELIGAFFTARATPLIALGSTFVDFTPPWLKDFAIATFGTNDKAALFVGMGFTILVLACVLGVVAYRRWALGVAGVLLMGTVIVASVVTRGRVKPLDAIPSLIGTLAGLVALRFLVKRLWRMRSFPDVAADIAAKAPERPATSRRAFFNAVGITAVGAGIAAAGGRLLSAARSNIAQARGSLRLPSPARAAAAVPAGVQSPVPGVTAWMTPNKDFYRIDTALSMPEIKAEEWELRVHGLVEEEVRLTFHDLLDAELIESHVSLTCVSNPVGGSLAGNAKWLGLPIREVLKRARPKDGADMVLSTSIDGGPAALRQGAGRARGDRRHGVGADEGHPQGGGPDRQRRLSRGRAVCRSHGGHVAAVVLPVGGRRPRTPLHKGPRHGRHRGCPDRPAGGSRAGRRLGLAVGHGDRGIEPLHHRLASCP